MELNQTRTAKLRRLSAALGIVAAAIGAMALTGWIVGVDALKSVVPGLITMKANTALAFILLGGSLHMVAREGDRHRNAGRAATLLAFVLSATVFSQYVHGQDLGVDLLLFHEPEGTAGTIYPGRMAVNTSVCFMLASIGLLVIDTKRAGTLTPTLGILIGATALLALVGYLAGLTSLYGIPKQTQMAIPTAVGILCLGGGLMASRPNRGPMRLIASDGVGGSLVRRILPGAVAGTLVLTMLRLAGQEAGLYSTAAGAWLLASAVIALWVPVVWRVGWSIEHADAERRAIARELQRLAERDPLTGLYNRRRLDEEIVRQLAIMQRYDRPFAVLMIDLDRFKQVNDTSGHAAGDALLVEVAHALKRRLRTVDYVARFGGDEFVVLLPDAGEGMAETVAEKLLGAIREIRVTSDEGTVACSASVGGVTCVAPVDPAWSPEYVLGAADAELYAAKAGGRDAYSCASATIAANSSAR